MSFGIFKEIERLVEYIPIETVMDGIGKLSGDVNIDSHFYFEDLDRIAVRLGVLEIGKNTISLRDIIRLLNKFLKDARVEEFLESPRKYELLLTSGSGLPLKNLLFEFSLSALAGDKSDAKVYLTHTYHILGLRRSFVLLLSIIVNEIETIKYDADVRELFTLLALMSEPNNVDIHFSLDENGFSKRYSKYLQELQKVTLPNKDKAPIDLHSIKF